MKTLSPQKFKIYLVVLNLVSLSALANPDDPGFPVNVVPEKPVESIENWIFPMLIFGLLLLYIILKFIKKKQ